MAEESRKQLLVSVKESLRSGTYSDLIVTCGSDTYNVHKMIICSRSEFFARAIKFQVGKESEDGKIDLPDDEPATIKLLVDYLYEGEYSPFLPLDRNTRSVVFSQPGLARSFDSYFPHSCNQEGYYCAVGDVCPHHTCGDECRYNCHNFICAQGCIAPSISIDGPANRILVHAKMYEIGDKYNVVGLKELSKIKFNKACNLFWNDATFPPAAYRAFSTTVEEDKGLRGVVTETISSHMELLKKPEVQALMTEFNGLALGVLLEKAAQHRWI